MIRWENSKQFQDDLWATIKVIFLLAVQKGFSVLNISTLIDNSVLYEGHWCLDNFSCIEIYNYIYRGDTTWPSEIKVVGSSPLVDYEPCEHSINPFPEHFHRNLYSCTELLLFGQKVTVCCCSNDGYRPVLMLCVSCNAETASMSQCWSISPSCWPASQLGEAFHFRHSNASGTT